MNSITDTLKVDVRHLNVFVRNFPESANETIEDEIISLIKSDQG